MADKNIIMKNSVEKILKNLVQKGPAFKEVDSVKLKFLFRAPIKTAMCDWVYGMKIYSKGSFGLRRELVQELQMEIKKKSERFFNQSLCVTDVLFVKN